MNNYKAKQLVNDFITTARANGALTISVTDYKIYKADHSLRHLRGAKVTDGEGKGTPALALYWDCLGNTIVLCKDGIVRQFH